MRATFKSTLICLSAVAVAGFAQESPNRLDPARSTVNARNSSTPATAVGGRNLVEIEERLGELSEPLGKPKPGEWLHEHREAGQTFAEYVAERPVRRSRQLNRIYLCLLGEFSAEQMLILDKTREYLALYFDSPVEIHRRVPLKEVPDGARRAHPTWGDEQILSTWALDSLLKPRVPRDALAYLAFTASDLWPGEGWNFVYGQANLRERTGVWSIYRNGDPAAGKEEFRQCLVRTLRTASHETGHILTMHHCTAFRCNMNGVNHQAEGDTKPLHLCPVCLRKLCWNLQVDPRRYLHGLLKFAEQNRLEDESEYYGKAILALTPSE